MLANLCLHVFHEKGNVVGQGQSYPLDIFEANPLGEHPVVAPALTVVTPRHAIARGVLVAKHTGQGQKESKDTGGAHDGKLFQKCKYVIKCRLLTLSHRKSAGKWLETTLCAPGGQLQRLFISCQGAELEADVPALTSIC